MRERREHHRLVIASNDYDSVRRFSFELDRASHDAPRILAAIYQIADENQSIFTGLVFHLYQQAVEQIQLPMDVANHQSSFRQSPHIRIIAQKAFKRKI
jgi:hypothetical protein